MAVSDPLSMCRSTSVTTQTQSMLLAQLLCKTTTLQDVLCAHPAHSVVMVLVTACLCPQATARDISHERSLCRRQFPNPRSLYLYRFINNSTRLREPQLTPWSRINTCSSKYRSQNLPQPTATFPSKMGRCRLHSNNKSSQRCRT